MMNTYESITLTEELIITEIFSIHYFEYGKDFVYEGESHDFWELLCVDNGVIEVTAGDKNIILEKGEMIFHKPNEFHALKANGKVAPNLIVISFKCNAECMNFFRERIDKTLDITKSYHISDSSLPLLTPYIRACLLLQFQHFSSYPELFHDL